MRTIRIAFALMFVQGLFVSTLDLAVTPRGPFTVASPTGISAYATLDAAPSWSYAYWAGRYLLAIQQDARMTPQRFIASLPRVRSPSMLVGAQTGVARL